MKSITSLIVLIAILAVLYFFTLSRAPDMLAHYLSRKIGVAVSIDSIKPSLSKISIDTLEIANAPGYSLPKAFSAKTIELEAPVTTYFKDRVVVKQINVDSIYLGIEFDNTSSPIGNWSHLFNHYRAKAHLDEKNNNEVIIKKLVFTNIHSDLLFHSEGGKITKLPVIPRIELTNISTKGGLPIDQLTSSILAQMLKEAFLKYQLNNMFQKLLLEPPGKAAELFIKPFQGLFNMTPMQEENLKHSA